MPRQPKIEQWLKDSDTTFKTLVMPCAFIITITYAFLFFLAEILITTDPTKFTEEILYKTYLQPLAFHLTVFTLSILVWVWSVFVKKRGAVKKFWKLKLKISGMGLAVRFKAISLFFLWGALFTVPVRIIILAISYEVGLETASNIFWLSVAVIMFITFFITLPPMHKKKRK